MISVIQGQKNKMNLHLKLKLTLKWNVPFQWDEWNYIHLLIVYEREKWINYLILSVFVIWKNFNLLLALVYVNKSVIALAIEWK